MKNITILFALLFSLSLSAQTNEPNANINLALEPDATVTGSVTDGRGEPLDIVYNPVTETYQTSTNWAEYGITIRTTLKDTFYWQVEWKEPKLVNYITFGGTYSNQPQTQTQWQISYINGGEKTILDSGIGGWIDSGIYEYGGVETQPFTATSIKVEVFGENVESIHLRGRGGISRRDNDSSTEPKATLIQLLPYTPIEAEPEFVSIEEFNSVVSELNSKIQALKSENEKQIQDLKTANEVQSLVFKDLYENVVPILEAKINYVDTLNSKKYKVLQNRIDNLMLQAQEIINQE